MTDLRRSRARAAGRSRAAVLGALATVVIGFAAVPVSAAGILPPHNPRSNIAPVPNFLASGPCHVTARGWVCANPCVTPNGQFPIFTRAPACTQYVLKAINAARAKEHVHPMVLPRTWRTLSTPQALFVIADLERVDRGLPPYLGLNNVLTVASQRAARHDQDPEPPPAFKVGTDAQGFPGVGGAWSSGFSVLVADYGWMYADGWGGASGGTSNLLCTSPHAAPCWGHRDELLGYDPAYNPGVGLQCTTCEMGTGFARVGHDSSFVDLVELPAADPPAMSFTWAKDVAPHLPK